MDIKLHTYLTKTTNYIDYLEIANAFFSFMMVICFIAGTYFNDIDPLNGEDVNKTALTILKYTEIILVFIYLADYLLMGFIYNENKIYYIFGF